MIIGKTDVTPKDEPRRGKTSRPRRVHSIAGVMKGRGFAGRFEAAGSQYQFTYEPVKAEVTGAKLHLRGRLAVTDRRSRTRSLNGVGAMLVAAQGGIGAAPPRPLSAPSIAAKAATGAAQPELEARASNSDVTAAGAAAVRGQTSVLDVDGTGALSFCGAMYFRLDAISGPSLGVAASLDRVQLNLRLLSTNDRERILHGVYGALVDSLLRDKIELQAASDLVSQLNKLLSRH